MVERRAIGILQALICILAATAGWVEGTPYKRLGCWKFTDEGHIKELKSDILDGNYKNRTDPIRKCYEAMKDSYTRFSIYNGGMCLVASRFYSSEGLSSSCRTNGTGSPSARNVYIMIDDSYETKLEGAFSLGCWKFADLPSLEGELDGNFTDRSDAVHKCLAAAKKRTIPVVAVSNGGSCQGIFEGQEIQYMKRGRSTKCAKDGKGGPDASQIYRRTNTYDKHPFLPLGCWKNAQLPSLEGIASQLDGNYTVRTDAIYKCYKATRERGWRVFAVADGGQCRSSANASDVYKENGMSSKCTDTQEGKGDSGNSNVYFASGSILPQPYYGIGCFKGGTVPKLEVNAKQLDGTEPRRKCYEAANERGWSLFTVSKDGACNSGPDAIYTYPSKEVAYCGNMAGAYGVEAFVIHGGSLGGTSFTASSPLAPGVTVSCGERIEIHIEGNNVIAGASSLHLSTVTGKTCLSLKKGGNFSFNIGLSDCGTTVTSTEEYIVYENTIRVNNNLTKGMIQRQHEKAISFRCRYNRKSKLNNVEFSGAITQIQYNTTKYGTFDLSIGLFKEEKFIQAVKPNDAIDVLGTVYARLSLRTSGESIKMAVQSCIATPRNTPPDDATYTHDLINNRCLVDSTVGVIDPRDAREFKFKFQSFVFAKLGDTVFVHCTVVVCEDGENTQTCTNPSAPCSVKGRRSTRMGGAKYTKYAITHGPFKQTNWKRSLHLTPKTRSTTGTDWRLVSAVGSGCLFVILVASVVIWRNKYSQLHEYTALKQVPTKE